MKVSLEPYRPTVALLHFTIDPVPGARLARRKARNARPVINMHVIDLYDRVTPFSILVRHSCTGSASAGLSTIQLLIGLVTPSTWRTSIDFLLNVL